MYPTQQHHWPCGFSNPSYNSEYSNNAQSGPSSPPSSLFPPSNENSEYLSRYPNEELSMSSPYSRTGNNPNQPDEGVYGHSSSSGAYGNSSGYRPGGPQFWSNRGGEGYGHQWDSPHSVGMPLNPYIDQGGRTGVPSGSGWGGNGEGSRHGNVVNLNEGEDGKREVLLLHQNLTELISLLLPFQPTPGNDRVPQPPPDLIPRLAHLANSVHSILHFLGPRFHLAPNTAEPAAQRTSLGKRKGVGTSESSHKRTMTSPEREMEVIRNRRDELNQRAKDGQKGMAMLKRVDTITRRMSETWDSGSGGEGWDENDNGGQEVNNDNWDNRVNGGKSQSTFQGEEQYIPFPDHSNLQQQQLSNLGSDIGVAKFDNRSSFILPHPSSYSTSMTRTLSNGYMSASPSNYPGLNQSGMDYPFTPVGQYSMEPAAVVDLDEGEGDSKRRCHGCGVVVEGEWMGGPDGPSSLCLSCGQHYARLKKRRSGDVLDPGSLPWSIPTMSAGMA